MPPRTIVGVSLDQDLPAGCVDDEYSRLEKFKYFFRGNWSWLFRAA